MSRQRSGRTGVKEEVVVEYFDFALLVKGYYMEGEKSERDYPGCASEFEIEMVTLIKGTLLDIIDQALNHDELVNDCIKEIERT
jgi:hypothetical protein